MSDQKLSTPLLDGIRENASLTVAVGIILLVIGTFALVSPFVAGLTISIMVGVLLAIGGVSKCVLAFKTGVFGRGLLMFVLGSLMTITGLYMVVQPAAGLISLTLILVIYLVVTGVFELIIALQVRPEAGWGWLMFNAAVTLVLGIMLWHQFPLSGVWAIGVLFGIKMIFSGWALVYLGRSVKRVADAVESSE
ncbi:MAG: HdeD family acid-resistance protein [bacterium]|nr:HdeD family acid-resistance protein [Gammaproteobacteria bacterium]HIL99227.1 HdeD family acid-resistance protein [Pseudomonadales bacterium]